MDRVLQHFLSGLATVLLIKGLAALPRQKEKPNTVELPRWMLILGLAGGLPTLAASLLLLFRGERVGSIVCLCLALLSGALALAYCNCRIFYDKEGFSSKSFLGITRRFSYDDIICTQGKDRDLKVYVGKRVVRLDAMAVGKESFLACAKKSYRSNHNGKCFPTRPGAQARGDLFRGNLDDADGFIAVYVVMPILALLLVSILVWANRPGRAEWERTTATFSSWQVYRDDVLLREPEFPGIYRLDRDDLSDKEALLDALDRGECFDLYYSSYSGKKKEPNRVIRSLEDGSGEVFVSYEDGQRSERNSWLTFAVVMEGLAMVWLLFSAVAIYVGRHPERFPQGFVYLFFQKDYVLYDFKQQS